MALDVTEEAFKAWWEKNQPPDAAGQYRLMCWAAFKAGCEFSQRTWTPGAPPTTDWPKGEFSRPATKKILASRFYLVCGREVHLELGAYPTASRAVRAISIRTTLPDGTSEFSGNPRFAGFRPVSGRLILKARVPYIIGGADA